MTFLTFAFVINFACWPKLDLLYVGTLKTYDEVMSLAASGDFSNIHLCLPDLMNSYTENTGVEDKPGKDAVVFYYGKVTEGRNSGNFN